MRRQQDASLTPKHWKFIFGAVVCLLSVVLISCLPVKPTSNDVVGLWVERDETEGGKTVTAPCAYFRFLPEGQFKARNMPLKYFTLSVPSGRVDASGTWRLDTSSKDPFALHKIVLIFDPNPRGFPRGLETSVLFPVGSRDQFWTGVESPMATFVKKASAECE